MAIRYGKGRVFHDTLGHVGATQKEPILAMNSVDYIVLLQRGTEWAATGSVTIPLTFPPRTGRRSGESCLATLGDDPSTSERVSAW
jgi:uncharacterized protein